MEISGLLTSPRCWRTINQDRRHRNEITKHQTNPLHNNPSILNSFHTSSSTHNKEDRRNFGDFLLVVLKLLARLIFQHKGHVYALWEFNVSYLLSRRWSMRWWWSRPETNLNKCEAHPRYILRIHDHPFKESLLSLFPGPLGLLQPCIIYRLIETSSPMKIYVQLVFVLMMVQLHHYAN